MGNDYELVYDLSSENKISSALKAFCRPDVETALRSIVFKLLANMVKNMQNRDDERLQDFNLFSPYDLKELNELKGKSVDMERKMDEKGAEIEKLRDEIDDRKDAIELAVHEIRKSGKIAAGRSSSS